ncbi:hypothetical protein GS921_24325 [Rhodococcus hoagii]|nr:hypothetical protein [Prescottella equi]NKV32835.1 hypothetical protein [Prescottella equi]
MLAAASAISGAIIAALVGLGPIAAPVIGAAVTAGPVATAGTAIAGLAGTGSAAGGAASLGAGGAALNSNPHAALGVENGINDSINQAKDATAGSINNLNIPGVPPVSFN